MYEKLITTENPVRFLVREGMLEENHPCMVERNSETVEFSPKAYSELEMWANAQRDGRPAEYRWRPLFNAAKFG